jgi:hypothetical protein
MAREENKGLEDAQKPKNFHAKRTLSLPTCATYSSK